jgi:hypothetical protein
MKMQIKITDKKVADGVLWYRVHVRNVSPGLLMMELRNIFGKSRILKIDHEYPDNHTMLVAVEK